MESETPGTISCPSPGTEFFDKQTNTLDFSDKVRYYLIWFKRGVKQKSDKSERPEAIEISIFKEFIGLAFYTWVFAVVSVCIKGIEAEI